MCTKKGQSWGCYTFEGVGNPSLIRKPCFIPHLMLMVRDLKNLRHGKFEQN